MKLARDFYARDTIVVAKDLLGKYLVFQGKVGKIVETEAYLGPEDLASHARFSSRKRNFLMFARPGVAYVYMTYGMYYLINFITEEEGRAGAVLIRALEPIKGIDLPTNGPGKLTKAMGINLAQNESDLEGRELFVEDRGDPLPEVQTAKRIGVDYAGSHADHPWRFYIKNSPNVSKS